MKRFDDIHQAAVVGAGTMGAGVAQLFAMAGYPTVLYDLEQEMLDKALKKVDKNLQGAVDREKITEEGKQQTIDNITTTTDFSQLKADVVLEAVVEKLEIKQDIFQQLADQNETNTILASNTSSIPITKIASSIPNPGRFAGMHFFNPAHIMKLVEVISGAATDDQTADTLKSLAKQMNKFPVDAKDSPGFIVNRVARNYYVEGLKVLEENVADHAAIDRLMESTGFRMGPFKLMDLIGVDTNFSVTSSMFASFHYDPKFRPSRIQEQKVNAGHHGRKTGKGFYNYEE